jgi:hypothetical protein
MGDMCRSDLAKFYVVPAVGESSCVYVHTLVY